MVTRAAHRFSFLRQRTAKMVFRDLLLFVASME
jgi:hypothetical protein